MVYWLIKGKTGFVSPTESSYTFGGFDGDAVWIIRLIFFLSNCSIYWPSDHSLYFFFFFYIFVILEPLEANNTNGPVSSFVTVWKMCLWLAVLPLYFLIWKSVHSLLVLVASVGNCLPLYQVMFILLIQFRVYLMYEWSCQVLDIQLTVTIKVDDGDN